MQSCVCLSVLITLSFVIVSIYGQQQHLFLAKKENLNKRLFGYKLHERNNLGLHACVYECMFSSACKSINYFQSNGTCEFNSKASMGVAAAAIVESKGTIVSDIIDWPMSMASGCAFHQCGAMQRCFPLSHSAYNCVNITCDEPQNLQFGVVPSGSSIAGSIRVYNFTCPHGTFLSGNTSITCLLSGEWTPIDASCIGSTVGSDCNSVADCNETGSECLKKKCFCGRLYRYDAETKNCVKVCSMMKDTFTVHANRKISGYNDLGSDTDITLEQCQERCKENDDCLSFEYHSGSTKCNLCSVTMEMIEDTFPEEIKSDPKDVYSRDCSGST